MREHVSIRLAWQEDGPLRRVKQAFKFKARLGRFRSWLDKKLWQYLIRTGSVSGFMYPEPVTKEETIHFGDTADRVMDGLMEFMDRGHMHNLQCVYIGSHYANMLRRDPQIGPMIQFEGNSRKWSIDGIQMIWVPYVDPHFIFPVIDRKDRI